LMPPLCTAGFGLATLNFKFLVGALYLYSINCFFIALSTFLVLKYLKYKPIQTQNPDLDKKVRISISVVMSLLIIPSFYLAYNLLQEKKFTQNVETFIQNEFLNNGHTVIYKNVNFRSKPKKIELAFLSQQLDSLEIARYNTKLEDYGINNTTFTVRQNNADLKQEILSELNKNQSDITEKDLKIQQLNELLKAKTFGDSILEKEIKILFPDISQIYFGTLNQYSDSISNNKIILYQSEKLIDENKLQQWIETKYATKNIIIQKM